MDSNHILGQGNTSDRATHVDLYLEQTRQSTVLVNMCEDVKEIKESLLGTEGLIVEVDRLKRSKRTFIAVGWLIFTTIVGTVATLVTQFFR